MARSLSTKHRNARFVVDVKSTALFQTDRVLMANRATTDYWKTGHSYIKRRTAELDAMAGFEKSGHFFFRKPLGRGYDDGLLSAIAVCDMLDDSDHSSLADLYDSLPLSWSSPTMSPHCKDDKKYQVVDRVRQYLLEVRARGDHFAGKEIKDIITTNGVRAVLEDGSWCLVRASSNKPELVVVCESMISEQAMRGVFGAVETLLNRFPEVGDYNQKL